MGRPRQFDPDEVLGVAMHLFWVKGYEATSLHDLLAETGLARQSLYNGFGDKHALFLAALRRYHEQSDEAMRACLGGERPIREALRAFMMGVAGRTGTRKRRGCLMVNSTVELAFHDRETARLVGAQHRLMEKVLHDALTQAQRRGELSPEKEPRALARFLVAFLDGLNVATKANADPATLNDMVKVALQALG